MNDTVPSAPAAPAAESPRPPAPSRARSAAYAAAGPLFDGGDPLIDDGIARANWAVPWSDLMMTMFVLFAALLVVQVLRDQVKQRVLEQERIIQLQQQLVPQEKLVQQEKITREEIPVPEPVPDPSLQINVLARSQEAVRETNLQNAKIVLLDDQSVKVSVQGPMFFAQGKADLRPEAQNFLDRLAQIIKQTPYDIHVVGHTDDQPISNAQFPSNWELSLVRASHVARYLIKSGGLEPSRFLVMGRGEFEPVGANSDDRSRALNRRVEIIITRESGKADAGNRR